MNEGSIECPVDIARILARLPHRFPFILVDRLLECTPPKFVRAVKNVSRGDSLIDDSDTNLLRMPQMLVVEAMAQTCALLCSFSIAEHTQSTYFFAGIDNCRFGTAAAPGDQLILEGITLRLARGYGKYHARALVAGALVAEADLIAVVVQGSERLT